MFSQYRQFQDNLDTDTWKTITDLFYIAFVKMVNYVNVKTLVESIQEAGYYWRWWGRGCCPGSLPINC